MHNLNSAQIHHTLLLWLACTFSSQLEPDIPSSSKEKSKLQFNTQTVSRSCFASTHIISTTAAMTEGHRANKVITV